eukprot:jgi/Botrbrau1/4238/Bobra.0044s0033.1
MLERLSRRPTTTKLLSKPPSISFPPPPITSPKELLGLSRKGKLKGLIERRRSLRSLQEAYLTLDKAATANHELYQAEKDDLQHHVRELSTRVDDLIDDLSHARSDHEDAVAEMQAGWVEERQDLLDSLHISEHELVKAREWQINRPKRGPWEEAETQTDEPYPLVGSNLMPDPTLACQHLICTGQGKKSKKYFYGNFEPLLQSNPKPRGKAKTASWALKVIATILGDKAQADEADSRAGTAGLGACDFVYHWHLTRFGLLNVAEINLADLIVTVQKFAQALTAPPVSLPTFVASSLCPAAGAHMHTSHITCWFFGS